MAEVYTALPGLRYQLQRAGISQAAFAEKMGVTRASVNYWISGARIPRLDTAITITEILGCRMSDLLEDPDKQKNNMEKETRP